MMVRGGRFAIAVGALMVLCGTALPAFAAVNQGAIHINLVRAVRISDTSVTLSFMTTKSSIATMTYVAPGNATVTLTDSEPQTDHLFTIEELDPTAGYTFTIVATSGTDVSNKYVILISPQAIGPIGEGMMPAVQEVSPSGNLISATLQASTTPVRDSIVPWWVFVVFGIVVLGAWAGLTLATRKPFTTQI